MKYPKYWIDNLNLHPHPEGGYYKEVYRSQDSFKPVGFVGERNYMTSIYFLLEAGSVSHFHSINSDELWYFHAGDSLSVHVIYPDGKLDTLKIGRNVEDGELPQVVVPAGTVFGSKSNGNYSLVGCVVSPGFDFQDFKLFRTSELIKSYPKHRQIIEVLSKEEY